MSNQRRGNKKFPLQAGKGSFRMLKTSLIENDPAKVLAVIVAAFT
jgi:hypothetical protein